MKKTVHLQFVFALILILSGSLYGQRIKNVGHNLSYYSRNYYSIPFIDLDGDQERQIIIDKDPDQYLGHPTTHLLDDQQTMICVYPKGHGRGGIVMKRSTDAGLSWSDRLPLPPSWATSQEVPTLFPVEDAAGKQRLIVFSGLYPARMSVSEDQGNSWSELKPIGDWGGIVVMSDLIALNTGKGHYMATFHDDQRFFSKKGRPLAEKEMLEKGMAKFTLYTTFSYDGGMTWSFPEAIFSSRTIHLCEAGFVRSPDGKQIAALLRENSRRMNSYIIFSDDEGKNWSAPRELPNSLTGDRHQAVYAPDGRLVISFRDNTPGLSRFHQLKNNCKNCDERYLKEKVGPVSPTAGDWVAWVGTYQDLAEGYEGQYRIRLKDNFKSNDCAYPAMEILSDGTIIATTYGHWEDMHPPYILSTRFKLEEIDLLYRKSKNNKQ